MPRKPTPAASPPAADPPQATTVQKLREAERVEKIEARDKALGEMDTGKRENAERAGVEPAKSVILHDLQSTGAASDEGMEHTHRAVGGAIAARPFARPYGTDARSIDTATGQEIATTRGTRPDVDGSDKSPDVDAGVSAATRRTAVA